jgi:DNA-binding PadR family transcriptional regulator
MLEEMGHASSTDRDGKKIYTITPEGRAFLEERSDLADEVRIHMRHHWSHENFGAFGEVIDELAKIGKLVSPRIRDVNLEKLKRISKVLSEACREIKDILDR